MGRLAFTTTFRITDAQKFQGASVLVLRRCRRRYNSCVENLTVRCAGPEDAKEVASLCHSLWPDASAEDHEVELSLILTGRPKGSLPAVVFIAETEDQVAGFIEVGARSHADGCDASLPVGYLEGWYVKPEYRRRGVGARLLAEAEKWARTQGYREMASDTWIENIESQRVHAALGFEVVDRCINYRKPL
jgi:aminoglycoside 6'-N-acetyltransferase I